MSRMNHFLSGFLVCMVCLLLLGVASQERTVQISALNGNGWRPASGDTSTRAIAAIDYGHHEVHEGSSFVVTEIQALDDTDTREYLIQTPDTTSWAHMIISSAGAFDTEMEIYETSTKTVGTAMTEQNRNRNNGTSATTVVTHTPGGAGNGNLMYHERFGADAGPGAVADIESGASRGTMEFVLKQNEVYLVVVSSHTDANNITTYFNWYEHTDRN